MCTTFEAAYNFPQAGLQQVCRKSHVPTPLHIMCDHTVLIQIRRLMHADLPTWQGLPRASHNASQQYAFIFIPFLCQE